MHKTHKPLAARMKAGVARLPKIRRFRSKIRTVPPWRPAKSASSVVPTTLTANAAKRKMALGVQPAPLLRQKYSPPASTVDSESMKNSQR